MRYLDEIETFCSLTKLSDSERELIRSAYDSKIINGEDFALPMNDKARELVNGLKHKMIPAYDVLEMIVKISSVYRVTEPRNCDEVLVG